MILKKEAAINVLFFCLRDGYSYAVMDLFLLRDTYCDGLSCEGTRNIV